MRLLAACAVAAASLAVVPSAPAFPPFGPGCTRADFTVGRSPVRAEFCAASGDTGAAVVVLHGCGGFSTFDHRLATTLPRDGIATLDVDYFEPTPPPGSKGFCGGPRLRGADPFPVWVQVARAAAAHLRGLPGVRRVGVVGWSLGGAVALAAAAGPAGTRPYAAVAGFSTGSFDAAAVAPLLPPTILLSGGATDAIPLSETLPLYQALRAAHVPSALYVYPHGSHDWPGRQGTLGIARAVRFLRAYLR